MALHMATSYMPQATQVNEEPSLKSSLDLTLMQHPRDEDPNRERCVLVLKLIPLKLGIITFLRTFLPW
jgi:hypothetical protein